MRCIVTRMVDVRKQEDKQAHRWYFTGGRHAFLIMMTVFGRFVPLKRQVFDDMEGTFLPTDKTPLVNSKVVPAC